MENVFFNIGGIIFLIIGFIFCIGFIIIGFSEPDSILLGLLGVALLCFLIGSIVKQEPKQEKEITIEVSQEEYEKYKEYLDGQ